CCVSPQLTRGKANRVHVIRIGAEVVLVSVRKVIRPTLTGDGSYLTARIPGQSCVRRGINVASAHARADLESRFLRLLAAVIPRFEEVSNDLRGRGGYRTVGCRSFGTAAVDFSCGHPAVV